MHKYFLVAGVSIASLAGCAQKAHEFNNEINTDKLLLDSEALRKNGNTLIGNGNPQEAVAVFDKLIAMDPQNPLAYNGKAVAFDYSGNHLAAQDIYQVALSLSPDSFVIKNNLAMSLILNYQIEQAIILLESLIPIKADNVASNDIVRHNLALAYGISGQDDKAKKLLYDLTPEQTKENIRFYKDYMQRHAEEIKNGRAREKTKLEEFIPSSEHNIGFIKTPPLKLIVRPENKKKDGTNVADNVTDNTKGNITGSVAGGKPDTFLGKPASYKYPE